MLPNKKFEVEFAGRKLTAEFGKLALLALVEKEITHTR
jgi:hypothetical protein